jgi:hypothetical protein
MSTQIFINPYGCRVEYTKISAHSFSFEPNIGVSAINSLFYGGFSGVRNFATWSRDIFNYTNSALAPTISLSDKSVGIPLPINLVKEDVVTISGTAVFNNYVAYALNGWNITLEVGVNYFNCKEQGKNTPSFTFIPLESFALSGPGDVCFETNVTLDSNFDAHETRFLVGFNIIATCPDGDECSIPGEISANLATVSYTFDIQRPCAVNTAESNFIIRNCCEPLITELVNATGLQVGKFYIDNEANCWEVVSASKDVTNFTRTFLNNYESCAECQAEYACPQNLAIASCCVMDVEFVTGSLPGLNVGDTFVDNHGLCWTVYAETGAPISEETIVVDTIIDGTCEDCLTANPCPDFWYIESCCSQVGEVIATTIPLNINDVFLDTNGICWQVTEQAQQLPTNYGIVVDSVYTGSENNCLNCTTDNLCPEEYFLTIRACCDPDRIEVTTLPFPISEGTIFMDAYSMCWEVMSYSTTGSGTYPLSPENILSIYPDCEACVLSWAERGCPALYRVRDCDTLLVYTSGAYNTLNVGSFYLGDYMSTETQSCFEVLGYGYPQIDLLDVVIDFNPIEYATCEECSTPEEAERAIESKIKAS